MKSFLGALGAIDIHWSLETSEAISGSVIYDLKNPEEVQDFIWHMSEEGVPTQQVFDLAQILNEKNLLDIDKIAVSREELRKMLSVKYGRIVGERDFLGTLESLESVIVRMVDKGEETDMYFIHE